ncbi:MAG: hypothetical protein MJ233_01675 [Mycoplasmoidaceae bacterium]|nr:hypothetical protein [Mycoplasmoidaceae bacterium]
MQTVTVTLPNGQVKKVKVSAKTLKTLNKRKVNGASKGRKVSKPAAKKEAATK